MEMPKGFRMAGVHCGIKSNPAKLDLALVVADRPASGAGVYTQNLVFAAPVELDRERTPSGDIRLVVINSGNANACTGERGLADAREMARLAEESCGARPGQALVLSTGIIGTLLPMQKITGGIAAAAAELANDAASFVNAARAMTTTDKGHKVAARSVQVDGRELRIAGMAKGAGMIGPRMATMLAVITTDAALRPEDAQALLDAATDRSFNCISVEGHMSTNDTVLLLASGAAHPQPLGGGALEQFSQALADLCIELACMIPADGEGATHLVEIDVAGCATRDDARQIARTIANSVLVKTAVAGGDPNWGRIISAAGYSGVAFDPGKCRLSINDHRLYERGSPVPFDASAVSASIREHHRTRIELTLSEGSQSIRFWTSDLTPDYVRFNTAYTT